MGNLSGLLNVIKRLKLLIILLFGTLATVFLIETAGGPPWLAAILGAFGAYGFSAVIDGLSDKSVTAGEG